MGRMKNERETDTTATKKIRTWRYPEGSTEVEEAPTVTKDPGLALFASLKSDTLRAIAKDFKDDPDIQRDIQKVLSARGEEL